jgi:membrane-bound ClpP family serine protease
MNNGKTIGMVLFIGGIILLIAYGLYMGFEEIMESLDFISGIFIGIILIGFVVLIISIIYEQKKDTKETMKDIKKEDLEP